LAKDARLARKILLADDSVTAQNMGRKILSDAGYDVVTVNNGSAALKRVAEQRPDLIVLDVYMPGYSGLEVCQRLKDSPETDTIPILLTVGKLEPFKPEEARRVRAEAYIVKPFEASELLSALTRLEDQMVPGRGKNGKSEGHGDSETGWKNRLRFPSKKKKEEPEPEPAMDFVGGSSSRSARSGKTPTPAANAASDKSAPSFADAIPDIPRDITPEELDALSALAAKLDGEAAVSQVPATADKAEAGETRKEFEVAAPVVEDKTVAASVAQEQAPPASAENAKPTAEVAAGESADTATEAKPAEVAPVRVETLAEQEPAPVDKDDEPLFAKTPATSEPAVTEKVQDEQAEATGVEESVSAAAPVEVQVKGEELKSTEATAAEKPAVEMASAQPPKAEEPATAPVSATPSQEQESPAPSEQELAEALRLLTPSATNSSSLPSQETLAAAGAALAEEAARSAATGSQWMAVAVEVNSEEAARSLEEEMFKTLGRAAAATGPVATGTVSVEASVVAAPNPTEITSPVLSGAEAQPAKQELEEIEEATPADEPAAVTFADAVHHDDDVPAPAAALATNGDSAAQAGHPAADTTKASTSNAPAGGKDNMGKENGKNGKSNWHQIRTATPAAKDAVEAAKQAEPVTEEAPKAMAAAADGAPKPVPDPTAIANIVDSVLADLRPKIVEEISKKLSGK
jgi:CheY-like chemotaxis protein